MTGAFTDALGVNSLGKRTGVLTMPRLPQSGAMSMAREAWARAMERATNAVIDNFMVSFWVSAGDPGIGVSHLALNRFGKMKDDVPIVLALYLSTDSPTAELAIRPYTTPARCRVAAYPTSFPI